ncbi:hypothetical protein HZA97_01910 [Candidatus Woesearchaeota archaeon]|nr:hypothetical protein [Candidatus Woesearchaeota archaeon]
MAALDKFYEGDKRPVQKDKKAGEWDFKGFFQRPKEEKIDLDHRLANSFRTIINYRAEKGTTQPKKETPKYKLSSEEEMGYFMIESKLVDVVNDPIDFLQCSEKKPADKCNNILLCITKQIVEDSISTALGALKNPTVNKEAKYIISPLVRVNFSDLDMIRPKEAIEIFHDVEWDNDYAMLETIILQPDQNKQVAIYQTINEAQEVIGVGAVIIREGGNYNVEELIEYDFRP